MELTGALADKREEQEALDDWAWIQKKENTTE
jgi:hypothetical protein